VKGIRLAGGGPVIPNFGHGSACLHHNGWFCTGWLQDHWGDVLQPALVQHIDLTLIAVGIGFAVSFVVALGVVAWFIRWVRARGFAPFAFYRIVLGIVLLILIARGSL